MLVPDVRESPLLLSWPLFVLNEDFTYPACSQPNRQNGEPVKELVGTGKGVADEWALTSPASLLP